MDESRRQEVGKAIGSKGPYNILVLVIDHYLVGDIDFLHDYKAFTVLILTLIRSIK